jgi:hypothetical protein
MWYVGSDVHLRQPAYCILDERERPAATRTARGPIPAVLAELREIKRRFATVSEASSRPPWPRLWGPIRTPEADACAGAPLSVPAPGLTSPGACG